VEDRTEDIAEDFEDEPGGRSEQGRHAAKMSLDDAWKVEAAGGKPVEQMTNSEMETASEKAGVTLQIADDEDINACALAGAKRYIIMFQLFRTACDRLISRDSIGVQGGGHV
jgi:hypothetical protein